MKNSLDVTNRPELYAVHPMVPYGMRIIENLPEKTGRSVDEWVELIKRDAPEEAKARKDWLRKQHKLGGTTISLILSWLEEPDSADFVPERYLETAVDYVKTMYEGPKSALRPIHDAIIRMVLTLGPDVQISPCKTIVPFYRIHVFAQIKPTTRTRIDLGLALKGSDRAITERIIDTGGLAKGDRITHRIPLSHADEVDDLVREWLTHAYAIDS